MDRINLENIAKDFGLTVEKHDVGTYGQWKDAQVDLYIPENNALGCLVRGVYPPVSNYCHYPSIDNIYIAAGITRYRGDIMFSGRKMIYNDTFNEGWLRKELSQLLEEYRRMSEKADYGRTGDDPHRRNLRKIGIAEKENEDG